MGNTLATRLDVKKLAQLKDATSFEKDELMMLYSQFAFLSGGKKTISKEQFWDGLNGIGISTDNASDKEFLSSVFDTFDTDKSGTVDFTEFCVGLSLFASGKLSDTLHAVFSMYNLAGNDYITEQEMISFVKSASRTLELKQLSSEIQDDSLQTAEGIAKWVKGVVKEYDQQGNGKLNYQEFESAVHAHPLLFELTRVFVSEVCDDFFHTPKRFHSHTPHLGGSSSGVAGKVVTTATYLKEHPLTWCMCVGLDNRCRATAATVACFVAANNKVHLYHQVEPKTASHADAIASIGRCFSHVQEKNMHTFIDRNVKDLSYRGRGASMIRYADANQSDFMVLGHPATDEHDPLVRLPWHMASHFDGLGVFIGSVAKLANCGPTGRKDTPIHWVLCVDDSSCGDNAAQIVGALAGPIDTVIVVTMWAPPGVSDVGKAAYSSDDEWEVYLKKLKVNATKVAAAAGNTVCAASGKVLGEDRVFMMTVENASSGELAEQVVTVNKDFSVDVLVCGLRSNKPSKHLYKEVKKNPWSNNLNAILLVN
eukprot:TRINITY_DN55453_c0_g1_i1.p1 TRINITY_DN55453_c0_g1~~TRINITY_DN55453_c0_g1_i1.p1  ORF type:complete len:538 (+),score=69.23 TRINITY_DN55453_c0_g1_i1:49-1662(+)